MSDRPIILRQIDDPRDPAIEAFGRMQDVAYFAPETLIPARYIPSMIADDGQTSTRRNFLVVAEQAGHVVAGTLFHWLSQPGSGFSSFLGVEASLRGHGLARRLHERRLALLDQAAGGPQHMAGIFIDVVNPLRLSAEELSRERLVGSDPWIRRRAFGHLGFRQVDVRYEQPVGGPNGGPVTVLDLLFFPRQPADVVATDLVVDTMRAYWQPWLGKRAEYHAERLRQWANGRQQLALLWPEPGRGPAQDG
jgi:GNAT superfamily N-acetyltransferase